MQKKKKSKGTSEKQLMKLWSEICKKKANHKCEYPGCRINSTQLHAHHFFSRRHASIRYDPDNAVALCATHHTLGNYAAHKDPCFKDIIIKNHVRTLAWLDNLIEKRNRIVKNDQQFKENWLATLTLLIGDDE